MALHKLDVYRVRNINTATIYPSPTLNLIYGSNGSGKSALLEAIFILGRARSFRTHQSKYIINHAADDLLVFGQCSQENEHLVHIGVQLSAKECEIRINHNRNCKRAELAYAFPLQFAHPKSYQLIDGGATVRREFMDWGIFNHETQYLPIWQKYKKCLLHRNALLKNKQLSQIPTWDNEMMYYAQAIYTYRVDYLQSLQQSFISICQHFFDFSDIQLKFFPGWDDSKALAQVLSENLLKDSRYGFTQHGPHRSDFYLMVNHRLAKEYLSRGQLKLFVLALKLAQIQILPEKFSKIGCFLVDDFGAELDATNKLKLLEFLVSLKIQVFMTANELSQFGDFSFLNDYKVFHVEHGVLKQV